MGVAISCARYSSEITCGLHRRGNVRVMEIDAKSTARLLSRVWDDDNDGGDEFAATLRLDE